MEPKAETPGTAAAVAPPPAPPAGEKIDVERVLTDDAYAAQVFGLPEGEEEESAAEVTTPPEAQPAPGGDPGPGEPGRAPEPPPAGSPPPPAAPAPPADPGYRIEGENLVLDYEGTQELVPLRSARNRLAEHKHLKHRWDRDVVPVARVLQAYPHLQRALAEAARGKPEALDRLLSGEAPDLAPGVFEKARRDPRLSHLSDEELRETLQTVAATEDAAAGAGGRRADGGDPEPSSEFPPGDYTGLAQVYLGVLESANPETHADTMAAVHEITGALSQMARRGEIDKPTYQWMIRALDDPRILDPTTNKPYSLGLYNQAKQEVLRRRSAGADPAAPPQPPGAGAPAPPAAPPPPASPAARLEPGAGVGPGAPLRAGNPAVPALAGKNLEERRALIDAFLEGR